MGNYTSIHYKKMKLQPPNFKKLPIFLTLKLITTITATPFDFQWESWKHQHNKIYNSINTKNKKYEIFTKNRAFINEHNSRFSKNLESYAVKLNKFADLSNEEFSDQF